MFLFAVSPLTGHVIGTGGFKVVSSPSRPGEFIFASFRLWCQMNWKDEISCFKDRWLFCCSAKPPRRLSQPAMVSISHLKIISRHLHSSYKPINSCLIGRLTWVKAPYDRWIGLPLTPKWLFASKDSTIRTITSCIALGHQLLLSIIEIYLPLWFFALILWYFPLKKYVAGTGKVAKVNPLAEISYAIVWNWGGGQMLF